MQLSGMLRAPDQLYDRIDRDLELIRRDYLELLPVVDDPDYVPDQLLVNVDTSQPIDAYQALNDYYLVVVEEIFSWGRILTF